MLRRTVFTLCSLALLATARPAAAQDNPFADCPPGAGRFVFGSTSPDGRVFTGGLHLVCGDTELWADRIERPADQPDLVIASGNVLMRQPGFTVSATRAVVNRTTRLGIFDNASGWAKVANGPAQRSEFGMLEPDVTFNVERIEKTGPRTYKLTNGTFTTCQQPTARWDLHGTSGTITLDERVFLRNAVLRVKNVPLLYLPFIYYPIGQDDRATGFLMPKYQSSTIAGAGVGNAFFWAIDRSQDATFYHDWFSKGGQRYGSDYRYIAAPGSEGNMLFTLFDQKALLSSGGSVVVPEQRTTEIKGNVTQALPRGFRLFGRADYGDVTTRQLYNQNIYDFSNSRRYYGVTVAGTVARRFRLTASTDQTDLFTGNSQARRYGSAPSVSFSLSDSPIGRSRVYVGAASSFQHVLYQEDIADPLTNRNYMKVNLSPTIRLPVSSLSFLRVVTSAQWQFTRWFESQDLETGTQTGPGINRSLIKLQTNLVGPVVERVWTIQGGKYADRIKHQIEPEVTFDWTSPFDNFDRVPQIDNDRQVGGQMTMTYGVTNRVLARRPVEGGRGVNREILRVRLNQRYYTEPAAAVFDQQNQTLRPAGSFSPLRLSVDATPTDRLTGSFATEIDPKFRTPTYFSVTGRFGGPAVDWSANWNKRRYIPGLPGFDNPAFATHTLGAASRFRFLANRVGGSYGVNVDLRTKRFAQQSISGYYNAQCCGLTFNYYAVDRSHFGLPSDRRFEVSFTLAGIGSFANPLGGFGDNGRR